MLFKMQSFTKNIKPRYIRNRKVACHQFCRYFEGDLGVCICVTCGHQGLPQPSSCSCKLRLPQPHFGNLNKTAAAPLHAYAMPLCCAKRRVSVSNCAFSWQRWKLRIRLENFKQISQLGKSLKHQPCSGPRLNFLLDFFCLKFFISTLPTTTFIKRHQGRRCDLHSNYGN